MAGRLKIAFFGLPLGALLLAADGHDVAWAGICRREAPGVRRLGRVLGPSRVAIEPDPRDRAVLRELRSARPDLVVSWFWTKKLPPGVLELAPAFGVHPSLLPRHRGPDPTFWAIASGDEVTGVTAHRLEAEYDTGAILSQRALVVDPGWDGWRLARALDRPGLALLREVAGRFAAGSPPPAVEQDERLATLAPEPTDEELAIRWSRPAEHVARLVRAAAPWPGAWTELAGALLTLVRVRPTRDFLGALAPGEAAVRSDGVAVVRAGDYAVELLEGRDEQDRPLTASDLAAAVAGARAVSVANGAALRFD